MTDTDAGTIGMEIRLFGVCEVRVGGGPLPPLRYRKDLWLLALLALRHDRDTPRDWLAVILWPDADESLALYNLRRSLSHLRRALGTEAARLLSPTPRTVRLDLAGAFADVVVFKEALEAEVTEAELERAIALYRGPLLADCPDEWVIPERTTREQAYLGALETLAQRIAARGEPAAAVRPLRLLIAADPYRESAYCALMQVLSLGGDRAALGQVYQSLRSLLRRDLNADPAPETHALYKRLSAQKAQSVGLPEVAPAGRASGRHLPVPLTDLIGRQGEIEEVVGWLHRVRLVTLLGPGGVGKTRLAIAAAEAAVAQFADGVWFVDLAPLTGEGRVADAVARTLGVTEEPGRTPEECLAGALAHRRLLLVLDNCEHVVGACAQLAQGLLTSCAGLRVLATSRQPLGLTGEQNYRVSSLATPPETAVTFGVGNIAKRTGEKDTMVLLDYPAVRLFVERARQVSLSFHLTPQNVAAVADLCRRLDGIPLALEMAAARMRSLSVEEINTRLDNRFRLLTGGSRSALPRQQTLRALVDWSYDLLTDPEKRLLARLSVFAGGWTLEAAEAVCAVEGTEDSEVLDLMTGLVDKSLVIAEVTADARDSGTRYHLLETIRQYAAQRLAADGSGWGKSQSVRARHYDWFLALAEAGADAGTGPEARRCLDKLEADHDNLRAALDWCLEEQGLEEQEYGREEMVEAQRAQAQRGMRLAQAMAWFWAARGYMAEGQARMEKALGHLGAGGPNPWRAGVLVRAASLAFNQADMVAAHLLATEALALSEASGDREGEAFSHSVFGQIAHLRGGQTEALMQFEHALMLFRALDNQAQIGWSLHHLGLIARQRGDLVGAQSLLEEALLIGRALGYVLLSANALNNLAWVSQEQDNLAAAKARSAEALILTRDLGERSRAQTLTLLHLGGLALQEAGMVQAQGHPMEARKHLAESWEHLAEGLRLARSGGHRESGLSFLEFWSFGLLMLGRPERAAHVLGAAQALRAAMGVPVFPGSGAGAVVYMDHVSGRTLRAALGDSVFASAWAAGERLSWEQAVEYALADADRATFPELSLPENLS